MVEGPRCLVLPQGFDYNLRSQITAKSKRVCPENVEAGRWAALQARLVGTGEKDLSLLLFSWHGANNGITDDVKKEKTRAFLASAAAEAEGRGVPLLIGGDWNLELSKARALPQDQLRGVALRGVSHHHPDDEACPRAARGGPAKPLDYFGVLRPMGCGSYLKVHDVCALGHTGQHKGLFDHDPLLATYTLSSREIQGGAHGFAVARLIRCLKWQAPDVPTSGQADQRGLPLRPASPTTPRSGVGNLRAAVHISTPDSGVMESLPSDSSEALLSQRAVLQQEKEGLLAKLRDVEAQLAVLDSGSGAVQADAGPERGSSAATAAPMQDNVCTVGVEPAADTDPGSGSVGLAASGAERSPSVVRRVLEFVLRRPAPAVPAWRLQQLPERALRELAGTGITSQKMRQTKMKVLQAHGATWEEGRLRQVRSLLGLLGTLTECTHP